jgi:hypothetical protein
VNSVLGVLVDGPLGDVENFTDIPGLDRLPHVDNDAVFECLFSVNPIAKLSVEPHIRREKLVGIQLDLVIPQRRGDLLGMRQ